MPGPVWVRIEPIPDCELAPLAYVCDLDLSEAANVRGVIEDQMPDAARRNPEAFRRVRELLMLHYVMRDRAVDSLGAETTQAIIDDIVVRICERLRMLGHPKA